MVAAFELDSLPVRGVLGGGGFAAVLDLPGFTLASTQGPFVLKRYHPTVLTQYHGIGPTLASLIDFRERLNGTDRTRLDNRMKWPLALVKDHGKVVGLVMSRLSDRFFIDMVMTRGNTEHLVRNADMYFCSPARSRSRGLTDLSVRDRVMTIARLGAQLQFLHGIDVTIGDIQGCNLAVDPNSTRSSGPVICMFDCDSYRLRGSVPAIPQPHALAWEPPELRRKRRQASTLAPRSPARESLEAQALVQNSATDVYKFGLFMIRLMAVQDGVSVSANPHIAAAVMRDPTVLGAKRTRGLLTTLSAAPHERPTMREVMQILGA